MKADLDTTLNVPEHAGRVTGGGDDLLVVNEAAAGKVAGVGVELTADANGELLGLEVVNGADVVETTAGDEVVGGGVGAGHHPGRAEGDGVGLVGREGVPDEELAVLRGGDKVDLVRGPVHGVDLGEVALERAARPGLGTAGQGALRLGNLLELTVVALVTVGLDLGLERLDLLLDALNAVVVGHDGSTQ